MNGAPGTAVAAVDDHERLALDAGTLCEAFQATVARRPDAVAVRTWDESVQFTWREYADRVASVAAGLASLGVGHGETVALMLSNRPEFHFCDTAVLHLGATPFSVYNTSAAEQIAYVLGNARCRVVICERQFLGCVLAAREGTRVEHVICLEGAGDGALGLQDVENAAAEIDLEASWRSVQPGDALTLIYTSGTTGPPKGVEITHAGMLAMIAAWTGVRPMRAEDRVLSYLPAAHVVDRMTGHYMGMTHGVTLSCVADVRELPTALGAARPTVLIAVPRVWEKLQAALESAIASETDLRLRAATEEAIEIGRRRVRAEQAAVNGSGEGPDPGLLAEYARVDGLVLSKLRAKIGLDQARWCGSGAAPTCHATLEFFDAIGVDFTEGWGMSELSGVGSMTPVGLTKHGTVGKALPGLELRLAEDGELLARGPTVMRGYRSDPEQTAEAIDADGWLHTGDIAEIDSEGYVTIVDRKKELIINAAGKNMSPANIEAQIKAASPLIGQAIAIGDCRPYNVALIVLDPDGVSVWVARHGVQQDSLSTLCAQPEIQVEIAQAIEQANTNLSRVEQIKRFAVLPVDWLPGGEELTPTMKLKRKPIAEKYAREIEALYE